MTVSPVAGGGDALARAQRENETLYAVIKTVSSSLDLDRVLDGIMEIATDATGCHACFIYFLDGERLVLRAASPRYSHLVGQLSWGIDEGLTGWVARTKTPEFIRDHALDDPRMKYVPELEEERFQSMVAVPVMARDGDVLGVVVLHTQAPREFDDGVLNFLVHTASLAAGAIENAKLYEGTRRRVEALTTLTQLSQALAAVTLREDLYDAVTRGARQLLGAESCQIWRIDPDADELNLAGSDPPESSSRPGRAAQLLDLMRGRAHAAPSRTSCWWRPWRRATSSSESLCCMARGRAFDDEDADLLRAVAHQTAVGLKKAELIERLTAENIVKDMFEALAAGSVEAAEAKAAEARCDLTRPHVFLHAVRAAPAGEDGPGWPDLAARFESRLRRLYPRAFFDSRHDCVRAHRPAAHRGCRGGRAAAAGMRGARARGGRGGGAQRRGPRRVERAAAHARGRGRVAHRPLAGGRRRRGVVRGARRLQVPRPPRDG